MKIKWYLQYTWIKLNILILTPLVYIENKHKEYKEAKLRNYVAYVCAMDMIKKK